jgi:O-antigen/teichoic acid export membrane protein
VLRAHDQVRFHLRGPLERAQRYEMVHESWPLMVNHFLATLFFKVDVFLVEAILDSDALGRYSIGYKLLEALMIIPSMFTLALFPVISREAKDNRAGFTRFYRLGAKILVTLALPAALISTLAAREMVLILAGPEYLPGAMTALRFMVWSMPVGWLNSLTQYVLISLDQQRYLTQAYIFSVIFTLILNLFAIPRWGYQASALIHIMSELALFVPFLIGIRKHLGDVGWWGIAGKPLIAAIVVGIVMLVVSSISLSLALLAALIIYPLLIWRMGLLTPEEQAILAPLFRRRLFNKAQQV